MLLHKSHQTSAQLAPLTTTFTPSRGPIGSIVNILGRLYVRGMNRGFLKVSKQLSDSTIAQLEHRNATVARVRYALAFAAGLLLGSVAYFAMGFRLF